MTEHTKLADPSPDDDPQVDQALEQEHDPTEIVKVLGNYAQDAESSRKTGESNRDDVWKTNLDLYWGKHDFSNRADWQSRQVMPEAPMFVDRFAAAMREALIASGEWYSVKLVGDDEDDLAPALKKLMDNWLSTVSRNQSGHPIPFTAVFEDQMKLGALMAACAVVLPKTDSNGNTYISVESVDPRKVWFDPTGRGMFRIRKYEVDLYKLDEMLSMKDESGDPIFDQDQIAFVVAGISQETETDDADLKGHTADQTVDRKPIELQEFLCDIVMPNGDVIGRNSLVVLANNKFIIRGPEKNPFWHEHDWLVFTPLISVPLSVYGKSYVENWGSIASTFTEMTNLILDAVFVTSMKMFALDPNMLEDPTQVEEGAHPNKIWILEDGALQNAKEFMAAIDMGSLGPDAVRVWSSLKEELREGAAFSEIALGQLPPKGDITATEINKSEQGAASLVRSIARTVEERHLEPILDLIWKTGLQHLKKSDPELERLIGKDRYGLIYSNRKEFIKGRVTFKARGISNLIDRAEKLRNLLALMQTLAQNEVLMQEFMKEASGKRIVKMMLELFGIDPAGFKPTAREKQLQRIEQEQAQQQAAAQQAAGGGTANPNEPAGAAAARTAQTVSGPR